MEPTAPVFPLTSMDYPRLLEVWEAAVRSTHDFLNEDDIVELRALVCDHAFPGVDLVGVRDVAGRIVGFAGVSGAKLEMLFVDPAVHGQGLGRQLLAHAIERMGAQEVDVNEQNARGVRFYLRVGAEVTGRSEVDGQGRPFPLLHMRLPAPSGRTEA